MTPTPEQFDDYQRLAGTGASQALHNAIRLPQWQAMTDAQRSEFIRSAFSDARKGARGQLMVDHPEIGSTAETAPRYPGSLAGAARKATGTAPPLPPGYVLSR